jgi:hypothetical protein
MTGLNPQQTNQISKCFHFENVGIIKTFKGNQRFGRLAGVAPVITGNDRAASRSNHSQSKLNQAANAALKHFCNISQRLSRCELAVRG